MKAIVLHEYGPASNLTYEDVADPKPAAGEVLVRVSATSINPADWLVRSGAVKNIIPVTFPLILGCDLAGTVLELGEGVTLSAARPPASSRRSTGSCRRRCRHVAGAAWGPGTSRFALAATWPAAAVAALPGSGSGFWFW